MRVRTNDSCSHLDLRARRARKPVLGSLGFLSLLMAASCSVGPDYQPPEIAVPERFRASALAAATPEVVTSLPSSEAWWTLLNDTRLTELIERARASNRDLAAAVWRIEASRAARGVARGEWFPSVDGRGSYERSRISGNGRLAPQPVAPVVPLGASAPDPETPDIDDTNLTSTGLDASWEIDVFGRVRRSVEAADARLEVSVEETRDVWVALAAEVASTYVEILTLEERLSIARANASSQNQTLELTRSRRLAQLAAALDVSQAESNLSLTQSEIPSLVAARDAAMNRLSFLLGEAPGFAETVIQGGTLPVTPLLQGFGVPREVVTRRPDVRAAERRLAEQTARIGIATADLYPRFSLTGGYGYESIDGSQTLDSDSRTFYVGPSFRWNLFDGGRIRQSIALEDALAESARVEFEGTVLRALSEIESAASAFHNERERSQHLADASRSAAAAVGYVRDLYREGITDFQNVLDAERTLFRSEDLAAISRGNSVLEWIRIYRALGGGWSESEFESAP